MIKKINSVKTVVLDLMNKFPETRDNDRLLMVYVWATQNPDMKQNTLPFRNFGLDFIKGDYTDPESIRRTRQKVQEKYPELRGRSYSTRTGKLEEEMREGMRSN